MEYRAVSACRPSREVFTLPFLPLHKRGSTKGRGFVVGGLESRFLGLSKCKGRTTQLSWTQLRVVASSVGAESPSKLRPGVGGVVPIKGSTSYKRSAVYTLLETEELCPVPGT